MILFYIIKQKTVFAPDVDIRAPQGRLSFHHRTRRSDPPGFVGYNRQLQNVEYRKKTHTNRWNLFSATNLFIKLPCHIRPICPNHEWQENLGKYLTRHIDIMINFTAVANHLARFLPLIETPHDQIWYEEPRARFKTLTARFPSALTTYMSAPRSSKAAAMATLPCRQAQCSAVHLAEISRRIVPIRNEIDWSKGTRRMGDWSR